MSKLHLFNNAGGTRSDGAVLWRGPGSLDGVSGLWMPPGCPGYEHGCLDTQLPRTCYPSTCVCRRPSEKLPAISRSHHFSGHPHGDRHQSGHRGLPRYILLWGVFADQCNYAYLKCTCLLHERFCNQKQVTHILLVSFPDLPSARVWARD